MTGAVTIVESSAEQGSVTSAAASSSTVEDVAIAIDSAISEFDFASLFSRRGLFTARVAVPTYGMSSSREKRALLVVANPPLATLYERGEIRKGFCGDGLAALNDGEDGFATVTEGGAFPSAGFRV